MAMELYKYKLHIHEREALPKEHNTSPEVIRGNFEETRKTIRETLASFPEEDILKVEKQLEELTKPMLDAVKLPQLGHLYFFLTKNSEDINKYSQVVWDACRKILKEKFPGEEQGQFFKNPVMDKHIAPDVLLMAGNNPDTCFVFPNIVIDKYPVPSAISALTDTQGTIDRFKATMEEDLAHPQRKAKWATEEATHKQLFRKEEMSLPRALRRYVVTDKVTDDAIRDIDKAVQRDRSAPELIWARNPEDFLEMYDLKGPNSCMTSHNNEGDYGVLARAGLHPTSLYGMIKKDGEPISGGVYIRHNRRTVARAVVWKHPSWKKWVTYRTYPDLGVGIEGKYFQTLLEEHDIIYYPNNQSAQYRLSQTNLYAEFEIFYAKNEKNIGNSIVPYPYFDGDPAGVNRYAKWDAKSGKLIGIVTAGTGVNSLPPGFVNMSGNNTHCIKLNTFLAAECPICSQGVSKGSMGTVTDSSGSMYHAHCVAASKDYDIALDHTDNWRVLHVDTPEHSKIYSVMQYRRGAPYNEYRKYLSRKIAAQHHISFVTLQNIMEDTTQLIDDINNDVLPLAEEIELETYSVYLHTGDKLENARILRSHWTKIPDEFKDNYSNWTIYLDRIIASKTKSGLNIVTKTQQNVSIASSGFYEPIYEEVA